MTRAHKTLAVLVALAALSSVALPARAQTFYPNDGDLWYNGFYFADSYFKWRNPSWYPGVPDPGYEHDMAIRKHYFTSCTTWNNLPYGYDDCPTAGVSEVSGDLWVFSFGSFHSRWIVGGAYYYGQWNFAGGTSLSTDFYLNGQENHHLFCGWDSIWCMNGIRSGRLMSGRLNWGSSFLLNWTSALW